MNQYGFYIDTDICIGCKACMTACMDRNSLEGSEKIRKVYEFGGGDFSTDDAGAFTSTSFAYYAALTCQQCDAPACIAACPMGALVKYADGIVRVVPENCDGCGACVVACPYHHPFVSTTTGVAVKCTLCTDEDYEDGVPHPACARACPMRALVFGPMDELRELYGTNVSIGTFDALTEPNVVVKRHRDADRGGELLNPAEVGQAVLPTA